MHELSHGSNSSKTRLESIAVALFMSSSIFFFANKHQLAFALWIIGMGLVILKGINSEPKQGIESKTELKPYYMLTQAQLACMLRNAETAKRKM
jgi:hypothetical protein